MRSLLVMLPLAPLALLAACEQPAPPPPVDLPIYVAPSSLAVADAFASRLPAELDAAARSADDPVAALAASTEGTRRVALVVESDRCAGCYRIERAENGWIVRGDAPLGIQYGLAELLEAMGVRFLHPRRTFVPDALGDPDPAIYDVEHAPELDERGLHLHTLHPIEAHLDFWLPSEEHLEGALDVIHWIVANRGNYVTYPALDDILRDAPRAAWTEHTRAIVEEAHLRGVRVGLGMQLFGGSSLQHGLYLVSGSDPAASIAQRLDLLAPIPFDSIQLSFGEFSGEDPDTFLDTIDLTYGAVQERWPGAPVTATVHVGNFPSTIVSYMGEEQLYYFLVRYARSPIVPWIHTVMYYDLFEDAGGAYGHETFAEHRDYLLERLAADQPVGYHPETAYWVAFDDSIPTYLPLYVRSRWLDLHELRAQARAAGSSELESHVVFSSGWEWGYWQNDYAVMRMSWSIPDRYEDLFEEMLAPLPHGAELAAIVEAVTEAQHDALIEQRLAAYLAGTDGTFAFGREMLGVWSQPIRPSVEEILAMDAPTRAAFRTDVVDALAAHAEILRAQLALAEPLTGDPFADEIRDGIAADLARTEFAAAIWGAAADAGDGTSIDARLAEADAATERARAVVERRHASLFDPDPSRLTGRTRNAGLYQYGYLYQADQLCHYARERAQLVNAVTGATDPVPGCV